MKLAEYLDRRNKFARALTNAERTIIGVKDYSKGWTYRYAHLHVPLELAQAVADGPKNKKLLKKISKRLKKLCSGCS